MISMLTIPFLVCIVLVIIHVYFGSFVLKRGIIFIDLALAQWAALGYLVGHWMGFENPGLLFMTAFGFTVFASLLLAFLKEIYGKIKLLEAVIGVVYISATSIAISLISITGMEGHHLHEMLAGHILFIQPNELISAYALYGCIGLVLLKLHAQFVKPHTKFWDFIFYSLFGLVVTSSVKMVGVLLVFSFLVIPLLSVVLFKPDFKSDFKPQLIYGWIFGLLSSFFGLLASMFFDIPPSFAIILVLIGTWFSCVITYKLNTPKSNT